jgi:hypothetical protein
MMPRKSRHRFAACTARLSASAQTEHYAQFKSWRGVAAWQRPRFIHHDGPSPNGLAAFRSIVRAGLRAVSGPCLLGCNHADCFCRGNRRFSRYVARQSQRPQPRGLFTRGQTGCLVFGRCFLTVQKPLLLLLENRFGSIACLMSVQRRYSFSGESTPQDRPSWEPDAVCRFAMWAWSTESTPFRLICSAPHLRPHYFRPGHATCPNIARYHSKRPFMGEGSLRRLSCHRGSQNRSAARIVWPVAMKCA